MRSIVFVIAVVFSSSCSSGQDLQDLVTSSKQHQTALMEGERDLIGSYYEIEEFHAGMLWEVRLKDEDPYPQLIELKDSLQQIKDEVIHHRGQSYQQDDSTVTSFKTSGRDFAAVKEAISIRHQEELMRLEIWNTEFFVIKNRYDALIHHYDIRRITHAEYGDSLLNRIIQWQDTLVLQGAEIGRCKQMLKNSGMESRSDEYRTRYRFVSEMEALHKKLQSTIMQVENQQSRYNASRQDEYFYTGPHMVERYDIDSSEGEFDIMLANMTSFRENLIQFDQFDW